MERDKDRKPQPVTEQGSATSTPAMASVSKHAKPVTQGDRDTAIGGNVAYGNMSGNAGARILPSEE